MSLLLSACASVAESPLVVRGFEPARYLGRWHEVARLDHRFERGLAAVTADYSRREDGGIDVINRGYDCKDREWKHARGRAYSVGSADVGQLKVSFFRPFYAAYHIVALDPEYQHAMVVGDGRSTLWILGREPVLPAEVMQALLAQAKAMGFAIEQLLYPSVGDACAPQ